MADEHPAQNTENKASWTKLFSAFRVALDLKKLLLAAGGIVVTALGWSVFAAAFYKPEMPQWKDYAPLENKQEAWTSFKLDRKHWNLMHEMAGPAPTELTDVHWIDAADVAATLDEFEFLDVWAKAYHKDKNLAKIEAEAAASEKPAAAKALVALKQQLLNPKAKPSARLRSWPWSEDRGSNQYLLAESLILNRDRPWTASGFLDWFISEQLPVLVEPLAKFLSPIVYFFNSSAGGFRIRGYLLLVILWTIATWGFFGGAICRLAAVQIARNEKISLGEAVGFAREKFLNFFTAPLFPLIFIGILTFFLVMFGLVEGFTFWFGDIVLAGLLWPVVLVLGLIMAVVVVGLVGWPLMNATISTEGSDNFDALSRSYSYVYQAFWHYLGYWSAALIYGAALIFFVGFMGSLVVYLGKWGLSQAPGLHSTNPKNDRDPAYLFNYAPTSFGWRDLLIKDSPYALPNNAVTPSGATKVTYEFTKEYTDAMSVPNTIGAVLVGAWVGLFFLLIVGFGYSYFWTASTLIYFLMRKHVDDTEFDDVYFEEGELETPASSVVMTTQAPAQAKPNTISLNVVDGGSPAAAPTPVTAAAPAPSPPPPPAPSAPAPAPTVSPEPPPNTTP